MKSHQKCFIWILSICLLLGCGSGQVAKAVEASPNPTNASLPAQTGGARDVSSTTAVGGVDELDIAIKEAYDYLNRFIPARSRIVILNIESESAELSLYIIEEMIACAINDRNHSVVERQQLETIREEQTFQLSGEVDDEHAIELGRFFGAQTIISGRVGVIGQQYRLSFRALDVQTAQVLGLFNKNISSSATISTLMEKARTTPVKVYAPGDTGPAGGIVFYDKGSYSNGWRYLEAAPASAEFKEVWSNQRFEVNGTDTTIGSGKRNTDLIISACRQRGEWGTAAQRCAELKIDAFDDWYLPSKDELNLMYMLHRRGLGSFSRENYWSSSINHTTGVWAQNFSYGHQDGDYDRVSQFRVRPIRAF